MKIEAFNFLPMKSDNDVLFELPFICKPLGVSKHMQGMDIKYNSHAWCKVKTTNIKNFFWIGLSKY
jgi:hypothetical protein